MSQATGRGRVVGDYLVGRQIGSGSFSVVWHARHRVHGTEVAMKEIATGRLNKKLQESLMSEIFILKRINHPHIIRLHDIIEVPGKLHLILEYCKGGDLSMYIQRHGSAGLQVLRDNNLIHRDLKPQNLLLCTDDDNAALKIADFGFARSLQPRGLAETLCGSPLYMAPEIMQLQKYDAKADLWSVGAILFQLVTGKTPFTGSNQIQLPYLILYFCCVVQLLQNIVKATELHFPPDAKILSADCKDLCQKLLRRNPVERLTFEEFFNHPFLSQTQPDQVFRSRMFSRSADDFPFYESKSVRDVAESSQDDCLPFFLDDDSSGPEGSPSFSKRRSSMKSTYGFSVDAKHGREATSSALNNLDLRYGNKLDNTNLRHDSYKLSDENLNEPPKCLDQRLANTRSKVGDSLDLVDQDYVLVSGPPMDTSSSSTSVSKPTHIPRTSERPLISVPKYTTSSAPVPIIGATNSKISHIGSLESQSSAPGTSLGSTDMGDALEQPSTHCMTRIKSLKRCACAITELVNEKILAGKHLEGFSIQLVILAIWKQALHICHTQAASAMDGSPSGESTRLRSSRKKHGTPDTEDCPGVNTQGLEDMSSQIEKEFLREVEHAEELAKVIEPGSTEMPDAMETIFQAALAFGRHGGVDELMGDMESATLLYSKAVRLLVFLLVEAPSLILNPPFSLTNSDRYRLRNYIDILNNRQGHSRSQRIALLKCQDQA
ncbi:serine/threonine-protein kinase ATG1c [Citrus sinensis]|uniref:Serine/threonine-protein kinase ATG1c n=1 Tax=Citrus sinensis TaxID=2711 RepID=A0ACB8JWP6_CITSI|nr:serine/threonine-protein kinase ATG1c [Citrus sinensis]